MTIYFMQEGDDGLIKIGFVRKPESVARRRAGIQFGVKRPMNVIGLMDGLRSKEKAVHARFEEFRENGEWFKPARPIMDFCASIPPEEYMASNGLAMPAPSRLGKRWPSITFKIETDLLRRLDLLAADARLTKPAIMIAGIVKEVERMERAKREARPA